MSRIIRVFFGHPRDLNDGEIAQGCSRIKEFIRAKGERAGKDLKVSVIPGRDDFQVHCRGDWDVWAKSVVHREHSITRKPYYDMIVIPSQYVGRATAQIVNLANKGGRPVFLLGQESLTRVSQVYPYDPDDWQGGFKCETEKQLPLPFKERQEDD
tara:strand:- start:5882 stop:6346 length:465 start_codon:yes stop_codon:yes gene_type:complete